MQAPEKALLCKGMLRLSLMAGSSFGTCQASCTRLTMGLLPNLFSRDRIRGGNWGLGKSSSTIWLQQEVLCVIVGCML
jgi:hypothetical protein